MSVSHHSSSRLLRALLGASLCLGLLMPAGVAHAAALSATLSDTATDACRRAAEAAGYRVEQVISAKQGLGDRSSVLLQLSKGTERFEFSCGYSEALRKLPALAAAPAVAPAAPVNRRDTRDLAVAQRPDSRRVQDDRLPSQPTARQEHEQRAAAREQARIDRRSERHGIPMLAWLLPLLLLPLFAMLIRRPEEELTTSQAAAPNGTRPIQPAVTTISNRDVVVIRNHGEVIPVYAAPTESATASGSLADGQSVTLSGRREEG